MSLMRPEDWRPQGVADLEPRAWEALRQTEQERSRHGGGGRGKDRVSCAEGKLFSPDRLCACAETHPRASASSATQPAILRSG